VLNDLPLQRTDTTPDETGRLILILLVKPVMLAVRFLGFGESVIAHQHSTMRI
jgi:hypothetical protein